MNTKGVATVVLLVGFTLFAVLLWMGGNYMANRKISELRQDFDAKVTQDLATGFPEFPVYPNASLEGSEVRNPPLYTGRDVRGEWKTDEKVSVVAEWYRENLELLGWTVESTDDPTGEAEQVIQVQKDDLSGIVAVELEEGKTEIVVDLARIKI